VRDAGYSDPGIPSQGKQFDYTYNQYGQKATETNLNGVVTEYTYGDTWGNLTQVVVEEVSTARVQVWDPSAEGGAHRAGTRLYDPAGWLKVWRGIALVTR
jgi:YD repeat-containing protein